MTDQDFENAPPKLFQAGTQIDLVLRFWEPYEEDGKTVWALMDVTDITAAKIRLERPDGTSIEYDGDDVTLDTDGLDGAVKTPVPSDDTAAVGIYRAQGFGVKGGKSIKTGLAKLRAKENTADVA